jgi:hypothetical protein
MRTSFDGSLHPLRLFYSPDNGAGAGGAGGVVQGHGGGDAWKAFSGDRGLDLTTVGLTSIPDPQSARARFCQFFPASLFPRVGEGTKQRLAGEFANWDQCMPNATEAR